jgi:hypothetical protein
LEALVKCRAAFARNPLLWTVTGKFAGQSNLSFRLADGPGITDEPKAARGLRSDWLASEHVLETYRGSKHSGFAATLSSQLQT